MSETVKPLGNRVLIKRLQAKTSKGGILLPDSAQEKPKEGEILAVGPGKYTDSGAFQEMTLKAGDRVLFSNYAGVEVKLEDSSDELLVMSEEEVFGVLV